MGQLGPVFGEAGDASAVRLELGKPYFKQGMSPVAADALEELPQSVSAVGTNQFHLQIVALLDTRRPSLLYPQSCAAQRLSRLLNRRRGSRIHLGDAVCGEERDSQPAEIELSWIPVQHLHASMILRVAAH